MRLKPKEGYLFRNRVGKPWTAYAMSNRFARLSKTLGVKHFAYSFRHGFCQKMLEKGVNHLAVAELMGHVNGVQVAKTYSHMGKASAHLHEALKQGADA